MIHCSVNLINRDSSVIVADTGCPGRRYTDLVGSKYSSIVNFNIDTSFVENGPLRLEILILKVQIYLHIQTKAMSLSTKQIPKAHLNSNQTSGEMGKWHNMVDFYQIEHNMIYILFKSYQ